MLAVLLYATLIMAVFTRSSLAPLSLIALLSSGLALKIVTISWNGYANATRMLKAYRYGFMIHLTFCIVIISSSLLSFLI